MHVKLIGSLFMASSLKAKFEQEAAKQAQAATPPSKSESTGVKALLKQHKEHINPPPPKVNDFKRV